MAEHEFKRVWTRKRLPIPLHHRWTMGHPLWRFEIELAMPYILTTLPPTNLSITSHSALNHSGWPWSLPLYRTPFYTLSQWLTMEPILVLHPILHPVTVADHGAYLSIASHSTPCHSGWPWSLPLYRTPFYTLSQWLTMEPILVSHPILHPVTVADHDAYLSIASQSTPCHSGWPWSLS